MSGRLLSRTEAMLCSNAQLFVFAMDLNTKKELFSYGYIELSAAAGSFEVTKAGRALDNDGIDLRIDWPGKMCGWGSVGIDVQVKCTSQDIDNRDTIDYPLGVRIYNKFRERSVRLQLLIVFLVPENPDEGLAIASSETTVPKCAYYMSLDGFEESKNKSSVIINI